MKLITLITFYLIVLFSAPSTKATNHKLFSEQGYPYDMLIKRTDKIKIIYSENEKVVNCRVELNWQGQKVTTQAIEVEQIKFNAKPFATCLPRAQAKVILATTFN
ncbi:hypothetical protein CJF42_05040 [Pseudoalteromonas sp. NBT06-2]|uniref:hypothetical protein n=1 Tax=Pseudoalteromonas sp. NBT06-2 TaxID=2025950 RepID=UPI000BA603F8|nr:hypothetical protein [Pseudoalteromonas sp. NBT06-2]PAJ75504.1 hypothetical protein CJF42_05040 [Pseudoalteromonas sp. NBT06-2]